MDNYKLEIDDDIYKEYFTDLGNEEEQEESLQRLISIVRKYIDN